MSISKLYFIKTQFNVSFHLLWTVMLDYNIFHINIVIMSLRSHRMFEALYLIYTLCSYVNTLNILFLQLMKTIYAMIHSIANVSYVFILILSDHIWAWGTRPFGAMNFCASTRCSFPKTLETLVSCLFPAFSSWSSQMKILLVYGCRALRPWRSGAISAPPDGICIEGAFNVDGSCSYLFYYLLSSRRFQFLGRLLIWA